MKLTRKEELMIIAIRNLQKKTNLFELKQQLRQRLITQKEYDSEAIQNFEKYKIAITDNYSKSDVTLIYQIIQQIGFDIITESKSMGVTEVSELFGISEKLLNYEFNEKV
jgi:predicted Zn-dependent protease